MFSNEKYKYKREEAILILFEERKSRWRELNLNPDPLHAVTVYSQMIYGATRSNVTIAVVEL